MNKDRLVELYKAGKEAERETSIPALFTVAQAILEAGYDLAPIGNSNNIYGIKYHLEKWGYVTAPTWEYVKKSKKWIRTTARFQKYPTLTDCIRDHSQLLLSDIRGANAKYTYKQCLQHYKQDKDLHKYIGCVAASYATDPNYTGKILTRLNKAQEVLYEMGIIGKDEFQNEVEKAKKTMVEYGIMKPYGNEYWTQERVEAAVRTYRLVNKLKITLKESDK